MRVNSLIFFLAGLITFFSACNSNTSNDLKVDTTDSIVTRPETEGDSLANATDTISTSVNDDIADNNDQKPVQEPVSDFPDISGTHNLTLHWIGWDQPGKAVIKKVKGDEYIIKGSHIKGQEKLEIDGTLKMIDPLKLEFDGTILTKSKIVNNFEPCEKKGKQIFLSTRDRKYWRLQNMENCEGGRVVDYVDIYF